MTAMKALSICLRSTGGFAALGACLFFFIVDPSVFAQVTRTTTVQLPKGGMRTVTFQGAAEADVVQAQTAFQQIFATARMKELVDKVGRNFTVNVVRDAENVKLGEEDQANFQVTIDIGDIERAKEKLVFPKGLPETTKTEIRQAIGNSLFPLILTHEIAGLAQPGHVHAGSPQAIIPAVNSVLNSLRAAERIKIGQSGDCFASRGVTRMDFTVNGLEKAPGQRIPGVTVSILGDVNKAPGPFSGSCSVVDKTFVVTSDADQDDFLPGDGICDDGTGNCTLRAALTEADQTDALDEIHFDIPGEEVPTIRISTNVSFNRGSLGSLRPVLIDGTTQLAGVVEIDGSVASPKDAAERDIVGMELVGEGSIVRGLVINRFPSHGFLIRPTGAPSGGSNFIDGNLIGTDPTGTVARGNGGDGLRIENMPHNVIGSNLISGNLGHGISIGSPTVVEEPFQGTGNKILGNLIGTDITGTAPLSNGGAGVSILDEDSKKNEIAGNGIAFNGGKGIALGSEVIAPNAPVLTSASASGNTLIVHGSLNDLPNTTFALEFFENNTCDSSGFGEGQAFIGSEAVATNTSGNTSFATSLEIAIPTNQFITATAIDPDGSTSEFTQCVQVSAGTPTNLLAALISQVESLPGLNERQKNALLNKLQAAQRSLEREHHKAAKNQLQSFIHKVKKFERKDHLDEVTADSLLTQVRAIISQIPSKNKK
jgi:hypothetical protein